MIRWELGPFDWRDLLSLVAIVLILIPVLVLLSIGGYYIYQFIVNTARDGNWWLLLGIGCLVSFIVGVIIIAALDA